ncbi:hypothetical protein [Bifidobacterium xylocopae]|uniref:SPOR domain-containing protein n=1 Tax=Bifidobacterium xylocopae TaxID=2493119 RepID=A0A366KEP0_9BIFI|nr:hypothetical protein [Bifidobacterium xylocopae]RBP99583.1 hypothetical protein CRD59_03105 [Bifidobacterium xylocopae]
MNEEEKWYFNTETGEAELGKVSPLEQRMGPYASREQAQEAWKIAKKRNEQWDEDERRWKAGWDEGHRD